MTISDFKTMVAALVNRTTAELIVDGQDLLHLALNDARRAAQRLHDFELCATEDAYLTTSAAGANWMTGAKSTPGGATAVLMKRLDEVWLHDTATVGATTYYPRTLRVDYSYTGRFKRELSTASQPFANAYASTSIQEKFAYAKGEKLFITTQNTEVSHKLVGIRWLADLAADSDPDIFLTFFVDWLKWATIGALNIHLKDAERFPIDQMLVQSMWESVKTMDGTIANMGESASLD